jgi:hypothetical protein
MRIAAIAPRSHLSRTSCTPLALTLHLPCISLALAFLAIILILFKYYRANSANIQYASAPEDP